MWSFFSRDPTKDFAYEIGEKVNFLEGRSLWSLHDGKKKVTGDPVSIFVYENKSGNESQMAFVKAAFKRIKTLRHPNFLTYLDGLETDKCCYVVTEHVLPLLVYMEKVSFTANRERFAFSWGLHQIAKAIGFLSNDLSLVHGNICTSSIFVDESGEWKLGGLDYAYPYAGRETVPTVKEFLALEKYDPPEKNSKRLGEKWSTDMWGLGCLIWELFNGSFEKSSSLKEPGLIPDSLVPHYVQLVGANPKSRPNPLKFIEACRGGKGFMDNEFVSAMLFMEEIQIHDNESKQSFFNSLTQTVDSFPVQCCRYKILPQLLHAFDFGSAGSAILAPLLKLGELLTDEQYQKMMMPCIVKLFSSTDRATRVKLLQQIELYVDHLSPAVVNDQIFPTVVSGFLDTNPMVREQTIKSMLHLAPKLNYKNLNEELLKHFARLQSKDEQGGIRTNTTVCLGKISCYLYPQVRQKVLASAFFRALKDPFPPARQAGVLALAATQNFFTLEESSTKILPSLCQLTRDPEKSVRDQVFKTIKCFLGRLEKVSEDPDCLTEVEKDVNAAGQGTAGSAGWAGWAVSGMTSLTSKIYAGKKQVSTGHVATKASDDPKQAAPKTDQVTKPVPSNHPESSDAPKTGEPSVPSSTDDEKDDDDDAYADVPSSKVNDGWDDQEWGDLEDVKSDVKPADRSSSVDAGFGSLEADRSQGKTKFVSTTEHAPASSYNWDRVNDIPARDRMNNKPVRDRLNDKPAPDDKQFFHSFVSNSKSRFVNSSANRPPAYVNRPSLALNLSDRSKKTLSGVSKSTPVEADDQWESSDWNDLDDWSNDSWGTTTGSKAEKSKISKR